MNDIGKHYRGYTIQADDIGARIDLSFLIDKWQLNQFQREIIHLAFKAVQINGFGVVEKIDAGHPLDPFLLNSKRIIDLATGTIVKKAFRLGKSIKDRNQDIADIVSACDRQIMIDGQLGTEHKEYSTINKLCKGVGNPKFADLDIDNVSMVVVDTYASNPRCIVTLTDGSTTTINTLSSALYREFQENLFITAGAVGNPRQMVNPANAEDAQLVFVERGYRIAIKVSGVDRRIITSRNNSTISMRSVLENYGTTIRGAEREY